MREAPAQSNPLPRPGRVWPRQLLFALVMLVCGALIGGAGTARFLWGRLVDGMQHPEKVPALVAKRMDQRLGLDDAQHAQVLDILTKTQEHLVDIRRETYPRVAVVLDETREAVAAVLTPAQAEEWKQAFENIRGKLLPPPH